MSDRTFRILMSLAVAVIFVIMSTPLTLGLVSETVGRALHQAPPALSVAAR